MKKRILLIVIIIALGGLAGGIFFWMSTCPTGLTWSIANNCKPAPTEYTNVTNRDAVSLESLKAKLAGIESVHFLQSFNFTEGTDTSDSFLQEKEGDIVYPYDFYYKNKPTPLPQNDVERDTLVEEAGLAAIAYIFNGMEVKRVNNKVYTRYDVDALLETNVFDSTDDLTDEFYGWVDATYQELNFFPIDLVLFWALEDMPENINKIDGETYYLSVDTAIVRDYANQNLRLTQPFDFPPTYGDGLKTADTNMYEMVVVLDNDMEIETVTITYTDSPTQNQTTTVFSNINAIDSIAPPINSEITNDTVKNINFYRYQTAKRIYYSIKDLYSENGYPTSDKIIRLDSSNDPIIKGIMDGLIDNMLTNNQYLNSEFEKDFWTNIFKDPKSDQYYYGYKYIDKNNFTITFIQEQSSPDYSLTCNTTEGLCVDEVKE